MNQVRNCGECIACCTVAKITGENFVKPPLAVCPYLNLQAKTKRCLLHGTSRKPAMCTTFCCSWLNGYGRDTDSPDQSEVMVSINEMNGGRWIMVMNLKPQAHRTSGKSIIVDVAAKIDLPVIVVEYDHLKDGKGDYVIVKKSLESRSKKITGDFLYSLNSDLNVYKLIIT